MINIIDCSYQHNTYYKAESTTEILNINKSMYINIDNSEINQNTGYCIKIIESEIINISECEINNNIIEQTYLYK